MRLGPALLALLLAAHPLPLGATEMSGSRAVINLQDGRLLGLVGAQSQSLSSRNGRQRIVADGIVIEIDGDRITVDGEAREMPVFRTMLEVRISGGEVELVGDP